MKKKYEELLGPEWDLRPVPGTEPTKDEPKIWDGTAQLKHVGAPIPRLDGKEKVTGAAKYTTDIQLEGMLHAVVIRSPYPAGKIEEMNLQEVKKAPGVKAIHEIVAVGANLRYEGQPLVAVAATSLSRAKRAAARAQIKIQPTPHVTSVDAALDPNGPLVYPSAAVSPGKGRLPIQGNLRGPATGGRRFQSEGDVDLAFKEADLVQERYFDTPVQTHSCLEPHGSVVQPLDNGGLQIWTSTQSISSVVRDVARAFEIPRSKVRVLAHFVGGGFGAKFGAGQHTIMAGHLALKTGKPVRLILDRREEHLCGGNRPSSQQRVKFGWSKEGRLKGLSVVSHGTAGVGTGAGVAAPFHMIYPCPHRKTLEYDVFTHAGAAAAFRAPGHPQGVFALEGMVDLAAQSMNMDPIELRLLNDEHPVRREQWKRAMRLFEWKKKRQQWPSKEGAIVRGVGAAASVWYNIVQNRVGATVEVYNDGSVRVLTGVQDIGGGIRTVVAQVAADALHVPIETVRVELGDSLLPEGPGSGGSKTTASLTPAIHSAAHMALQKLASFAAPVLGVLPEDIEFRDGFVLAQNGNTRISFKDLCRSMPADRVVGHGERKEDRPGILNSPLKEHIQLGKIIAGVQLVQVAVDTQLGIVRVEDVLAIHDCGRVMNPLQAQSQVNGGVIQGLSYALYEERRLDPIEGKMLNPNLENYRIAGVADLPNISVHLTNTYSGRSSTGAMGLGEPATVPTAAAVRNAIYHATGAFMTSLPMTPRKVVEALRKEGS